MKNLYGSFEILQLPDNYEVYIYNTGICEIHKINFTLNERYSNICIGYYRPPDEIWSSLSFLMAFSYSIISGGGNYTIGHCNALKTNNNIEIKSYHPYPQDYSNVINCIMTFKLKN